MSCRAAVIASAQRRDAVRAVAHRAGAVEIIEASSSAAVRDLARDGRVGLVVVGDVEDLGATPQQVFRLLAALSGNGVKLAIEALGVTPEQAAPLLLVVASVVGRERRANLERAREGRARAQSRGVPLGRRPRAVDVARARELLAQQRGVREVARVLGTSARSLRRQLAVASEGRDARVH